MGIQEASVANKAKPITEFMLLVVVLVAIAVDPSLNKHEIRNEWRNLALQDSGIAPDNVLVLTVRLVELIHHCALVEEQKKKLFLGKGGQNQRFKGIGILPGRA